MTDQKCSNYGKIKGVMLVPNPSRYLIKKYGQIEAEKRQIERIFKKFNVKIKFQ